MLRIEAYRIKPFTFSFIFILTNTPIKYSVLPFQYIFFPILTLSTHVEIENDVSAL